MNNLSGPILEVENLSVNFGYEEVLKNISFSANEKDIITIIGPNGAGKTVLFRALLELVSFEGVVKWKSGIKIGYVPQKLLEKSEMPLTVREFFHLKSKQPLSEGLKAVGLNEEILNRQLTYISRGQFQRVLVAWAILNNPEVLLFDEPTAGIDLAGEDTIYNLLRKLRDERKMTILIISHDLNIVYRFADKVLCLNRERLCFGKPKEALTNEQIGRLYGESAFYHHG